MKMRMIVRLVAVVAIATVMMLSSYAVAEQLSPAEEDVVFANATIDTYKYNYTFDMDTTMEMQGNVAGAIDVTMVTNGSYIVNNTNKTMPVKTGNMHIVNMSISRNTTGKIAEIEIVKPETVSVHINDSVYMVPLWNPKLSELVEVMGSPESYETFWKSQGLLNSSDVVPLADEIVGGVDCNVLKIVADAEKFWEIVMNQSETFRELQNLLGFGNQSIMDVSTTQWIAKDTGFLQKSQTTLKTVTKLEDFDKSDTDAKFTMTRDIKMEMQFGDYNEPESDIPQGPL
ncbi:MAG: hypothetical protein GQ523_03990 [Methanophagales archaeon]|jgi:hypothetical protein|nr:hypothetical protein [Methanophagales archaeon]